MDLQNAVVEGVIAVLVIGWIMYRQTRWQVLDGTRMWRGPIILGVVGVVQAKSAFAGQGIGTVAIALLVLSAVLSVGVGAAMGRLSQLRWADGHWEARTGWIGSLLWLVLLAVRIGVDVLAHLAGAEVVASLGVILLIVAVNRAARTLVLARRAEQAQLIAAH
ncbi:hypothetical protein AB0N05_10800 [Nocardia sp. NPDC051030]|uniref:hypothetical protein n=1 Tax=Nocardia sp. NPDC051030 TaxID=3155162 RepID=UPI00341FD7DE